MRTLVAFALLGVAAAIGAPRPLTIVNPAFHQYEGGPVVPKDQPFQTGEAVFFSFQIAGFTVLSAEEQKIDLKYSIEAVDSSGVLLAPPTSDRVVAELAPEDKNWLPKVWFNVQAPPEAAPGEYTVRVKVHDELGRTDAAGDFKFLVRGRDVAPSDTLAVRNFRFLRSEDDSKPLEIAAYRPGDSVWARFEITGYKAGEKNRIQVDYGLSVLRPSGKELFAEPKAAEEQDSPFYPKRYVNGILSLNLTKDLPKGEYTIVLTARDHVGGQTVEERYPFRVE